jgi:hypothetical protein
LEVDLEWNTWNILEYLDDVEICGMIFGYVWDLGQWVTCMVLSGDCLADPGKADPCSLKFHS